MTSDASRRPVSYAIGAAVLFGLSTPLAKSIGRGFDPLVLAALLYCGSGVGLSIVLIMRRMATGSTLLWPAVRDWPFLAGAILFGGAIAPALLMVGLLRTDASHASLLLNLEAVLTALLAWMFFRENVDRKIVVGMVLIVVGSLVLGYSPGGAAAGGSTVVGPLLIAGACLCWAIDNNFTRKVALSDAVLIAALKGLIAGGANLAIALLFGRQILATGLPQLTAVAVLGFVGYGLSLVCFVLALRHLGASRTGAYYSAAPFVGVAYAVALLHEPLTAQILIASVLMLAGVWLHLSERHAHEHTHVPMQHAHSHTHDAHHQHAHDFPWDGQEPHVHPHEHERLTHEHAHYPDSHHAHEHS